MDNKTAKFSLAARFLEPSELEAFAAEQDPYKTWIHFVFTDDKPNQNKQRVPNSEFDSLAKSAKYMPIKKLAGGVGDTHEGAVPMGSIASTKISEVSGSHTIEGLATLWNKEFPDDIAFLRQRFANGENINFSWEIGYKEAVEDPNYPGVKMLTGCSTRAATIVAMPSYGDRTRVLAMASAVGESFEERIDKIDTALRQFTLPGKTDYLQQKYYLRQTFAEEIVLKDNEDGNYYRIRYTISSEGQVSFNFTEKVRVTQEYVDAHSLAAADDAAKKAQEARSRKYGISIRKDGNITKPSEYSSISDSEFADPVNYAYPIDKAHILAAIRYWGKPKNKAKYDSKSQGVITRRIQAAAKRHGVGTAKDKNGGESTMELSELKEQFVGLEPADQALAAFETVETLLREFEDLKDKHDELLEEKERREQEDARAKLLNTRVSALKEAGIEYSAEKLEANAKALIEMSDEAFALFVSQLTAKIGNETDASSRIPQAMGNATEDQRLAIIKATLTKKGATEGDKK
jgi:hypothetical protein